MRTFIVFFLLYCVPAIPVVRPPTDFILWMFAMGLGLAFWQDIKELRR